MCKRISFIYDKETCNRWCPSPLREKCEATCPSPGSPDCATQLHEEPIQMRLDCCLAHFEYYMLEPERAAWESFFRTHPVRLESGGQVPAFTLLDWEVRRAVEAFFGRLVVRMGQRHAGLVERGLRQARAAGPGLPVDLTGCHDKLVRDFRGILVQARSVYASVVVVEQWAGQAEGFVRWFRDHVYR